MRNGFKVYDSDTHVTASAEELDPTWLPPSRDSCRSWRNIRRP